MNWSSIIANFQTFNLADLLDVLVVTFVIYQILGIVSRTRAGQLARGALVVALIYLIATTANMRTVTWIMDSLLQVGLLTLVVVFQPEIRRALERMGQTDQWFLKFFRVRHVDPATRGSWRSAIIAICDAAERFSETKTASRMGASRPQGACCPCPTTWTWARIWAPGTGPALASPKIRTPSPSWSARRPASSPWPKTAC